MRNLVLLLLLTNCSLVMGQNSTLKQADKYFQLADYTNALPLYKEVIKQNPNDQKAQLKIAQSYFNMHDYEKSEYWYYLLSKSDDLPSKEILLQYGQVLKSNQKYKDAKKIFKKYASYNWAVGDHFMKSCDEAERLLIEKPRYKVILAEVNSKHADFGPAFLNEKIVYSSCKRQAVLKSAANKDLSWSASNQLFEASATKSGKLERVRPVGGDYVFQEKLNEGPVSYAKNGRMVAYTKNNFVSGIKIAPNNGTQLTLHFADIDANGSWKNRRSFKYNSSQYSVGYPNLSEDGKTLYFSSNMGKTGGYDLYVSHNNNGKWSTPKNLGGNINTPGNEISPFEENGVLYFSSDYHKGIGGYDIFKSTLNKGRWSNIENLGKYLNSSRDETSFIYDSKFNLGFITSNRKSGVGLEDIYRINYSAQRVKFIVRNKNSKLRIDNAKLNFKTFDGSVFVTNTKGEYEFSCPLGVDVKVNVSKSGFEDQQITFSAKGSNINNQIINVDLTPNGNQYDEYEAIVINPTNGKAVTNATVTLTPRNTAEKITLKSDAQGKIKVRLAKNATYQMTASKWSYDDTKKTINTLPYYNPAILSTINLHPQGSKEKEIDELALIKRKAETKPAPAPKPVAKKVIKKPTPKKAVVSDTPQEKKEVPNNAYYVQIGAFSNAGKDKFVQLAPRKKELFYEKRSDLKVYKLGPYATLWSATQAKRDADQAGFNGAFVIHPKKASKSTAPKTNVVVSDRYRVQLGAYSKPAYFDKKKAGTLGRVIAEKAANGLTYFYIGEFASKWEAKKVMNKAATGGFKDAYVVHYKNGKKEKVKD